MSGWSGRLIGAMALTCAAIGLVPAAASAADPGRWDAVGRETVPITYFQGITSEPGGDLFFDGISTGLYRTDSQLTQEFGSGNVIPSAVSAAPPAGEGYNHLGDITYDQGRILLPLECYYPGTPGGGNTCKTGSIGVTDLAGNWQYYVRLDDADIAKAMWVEASDDGTKLYTQGGNSMTGGANSTLLVYDASAVTSGNQATPGSGSATEITPSASFPSALPPGQMTGATFFRGRLYVARTTSNPAGPTDTFQVYSLNPNTGGDLRLEIEKQVAGESEGLDVNGSFGSVLDWQIMPFPSQLGVQTPTYTPGAGSLLSFVPKVGGTNNGDIVDTDDDGVADADDTCVNQPGTGPAGCPAATADPGDEDQDRINTNIATSNPPDNCPLVANNFQANADQDAQGDACDTNDDNDSVLDGPDNCDFVPNSDQANADGDAKGNACEDDDDNDGKFDYYDNCPVNPNADQADSDGDGVGNVCQAMPPPPTPADTTPPDTNIGKVTVKKNKATIIFATTDPTGGTYECKLDGKAVKGECKSPLKLKKLKPGKHRFEVAAVDLAGNVDRSPAKTKLKVKKPKKKRKG